MTMLTGPIHARFWLQLQLLLPFKPVCVVRSNRYVLKTYLSILTGNQQQSSSSSTSTTSTSTASTTTTVTSEAAALQQQSAEEYARYIMVWFLSPVNIVRNHPTQVPGVTASFECSAEREGMGFALDCRGSYVLCKESVTTPMVCPTMLTFDDATQVGRVNDQA